jgi:AcrR family transcriptional regulator
MDAIADEADVARATVFNYFPQKVSFLEEWGIRRRARVSSELDDADMAAADPATRLAGYLKELARLNEEARAESIILMTASTHQGRALQDPALPAELANLIREGQQAGIYRQDADAARAGHLLSAGYFATVTRWTEEPPPFDLTAELEAMVRLLTAGLSSS